MDETIAKAVALAETTTTCMSDIVDTSTATSTSTATAGITSGTLHIRMYYSCAVDGAIVLAYIILHIKLPCMIMQSSTEV
jgi:hypothetical protein